jgi:hypothetical protein
VAELSESERRTRVASAQAAVKDLIEELKTLEYAATAIHDPLTLAAVEAAFEERKTDDDVRLRVAALSWAATACCNHFNTIIQNGSVLAGYRDPEGPGYPPPSVTVDYGHLRDSGIISSAHRQRLSELNSARIRLTHAYGLETTPGDLHKAATLARQVLTTFGEDFGPWLREVGVLPKP